MIEIRNELTDEAVLSELAARIKRHRLQRNITQADLAHEAGISTPTMQRLEAGATVQLISLLRVLRALQMLDRLDALVPRPLASPMELLERAGQQRQRASKPAESDVAPAWTWGDES